MLRLPVRIVGIVAAVTFGLFSGGQTVQDPPQTVRLSAVMQRISTQPDYAERVQALLGSKGNTSFLTTGLRQDLRKLILGKDWQRLDHFPSFTIGALNQSVRVAERAAGNSASAASEYAT